MGSVAATTRQPADIGAIFNANPGRRGNPTRVVQSGVWTLAASGSDSWFAESDGWIGVGTGVLDDVPPGLDPGHHLLRAARQGGRGLSRLRGVFSGIATDGREVIAFRDHLGFSPLFLVRSAVTSIATTARQALVGAGLRPEPDEETIRRVFWGKSIAEGAAYYGGAQRIPKATVLTWKDGRHRVERYWDPRPLLETLESEADQRDEFLFRLKTASRRALGSQSVVALSGGIDAPAVAAAAAPGHLELYGRRLAALSSVYPDQPAVDESQYIQLVAERLDLELHTFVPSAGPLENIRELLDIAEGPVPTVSLAESAEYYRLARELGFHTILTGEMAEFVMAMGSQTLRHLLRQRRFGSVRRYLAAERQRGVSRRRVARMAVAGALPEAWLQRRRHRRGRLPQQQVAWLSPEMVGEPVTALGKLSDPWESQQLSAFEGPGLSVEADEAIQVASGVRVRRPWLDVDMWEFFLSLPAEVKYPSGQYKALVRRWLRGLVPDEILDRRDRTYFDDSFFARLNLSVMRDLISSDGYEMPGVDYLALKKRLDEGGLSLIEAMWAKDLAVIHAFMDGK